MHELMQAIEATFPEQAMRGFATLMTHVCRLYTCGESSSVSELEGHELAESVLYVLDYAEGSEQQTIKALCSANVVAVWAQKCRELESRIPSVMELWREVATVMPPIHNIALRDTLASVGSLPRVYDTYFAAHEVPVSIDYPLSEPVPEYLKGLDYVEAWLAQLLAEARFLAQFKVSEMVSYLESWCPDYRGLLINLYDPIYEAWRSGRICVQPAKTGTMSADGSLVR